MLHESDMLEDPVPCLYRMVTFVFGHVRIRPFPCNDNSESLSVISLLELFWFLPDLLCFWSDELNGKHPLKILSIKINHQVKGYFWLLLQRLRSLLSSLQWSSPCRAAGSCGSIGMLWVFNGRSPPLLGYLAVTERTRCYGAGGCQLLDALMLYPG